MAKLLTQQKTSYMMVDKDTIVLSKKGEMMFKNTVKDYSDKKVRCVLQLADVKTSIKIVKNLSYVADVDEIEEGIIISIAVQQIPEIIQEVSSKNIAIYSVIPL